MSNLVDIHGKQCDCVSCIVNKSHRLALQSHELLQGLRNNVNETMNDMYDEINAINRRIENIVKKHPCTKCHSTECRGDRDGCSGSGSYSF